MFPFEKPLEKKAETCGYGFYLVTEDQFGIVDHLIEKLRENNCDAVKISREICASPKHIKEAIATARADYGEISGIIHLASMSLPSLPVCLDDWKTDTQIAVKSLYQIVKNCLTDLSAANPVSNKIVFAASRMGGDYGRGTIEKAIFPANGGHQGIVKTLVIEHPQINVKSIDFSYGESEREIADLILSEIQFSSGETEIGYSFGKRTEFCPVLTPLEINPHETMQIESDWVILVTGGAKGITAETIKYLAKDKMKIIVIGRTPEPSFESVNFVGDLPDIRAELIAQTKMNDRKITPAEIEREARKRIQEKLLYQNLQILREKASVVEYHSVNACDDEEMKNLIDGIYERYGRLDAFIHGAGIIEDKLIADKTDESFDKVFDTKVDSAFLLAKYIDLENLRLGVFFSSTAGRFGNKGQADYAAANEILNRFAWYLAQKSESKARFISINWDPWRSVGMVDELVAQQFARRGISQINIEEGCQFLLDEILHGNRHSIEIITRYAG